MRLLCAKVEIWRKGEVAQLGIGAWGCADQRRDGSSKRKDRGQAPGRRAGNGGDQVDEGAESEISEGSADRGSVRDSP